MALFLPILLGTVREGRRSEAVAGFVAERLAARGQETRVFDPRDWPFGNLDQREWEMDPRPAWVDTFVREMARADGFVIVSPEYNHGYPGALKNTLDALYDEWNRKPFALVGVGGVSGGMRMIEQLRGTIAGLGAIAVPEALAVTFVAKEFGAEGPLDDAKWSGRLDGVLDELEWYADALKAARAR